MVHAAQCTEDVKPFASLPAAQWTTHYEKPRTNNENLRATSLLWRLGPSHPPRQQGQPVWHIRSPRPPLQLGAVSVEEGIEASRHQGIMASWGRRRHDGWGRGTLRATR